MFWEQFWPQLIATIIGIVIGIPVALWISGFQEKRTEKEKKTKILGLLYLELNTNRYDLNCWKNKKRGGDLEAGTFGLKLNYETWKAFSDGGELEWIKDPSILYRLSDAYYHIKVVQNYSEKYYTLTILDSSGITKNTIDHMYIFLDTAVEKCIDSIDGVIEILENKT
jgi:hypothetical protein